MTNRRITANDRANAERLSAIWATKKKSLGLTQVKAAARLGFSHQSTVSQYLNCDIAMNTEVVLKFARLLEVDPARIDPSIRSLVVRDLHPTAKKMSIVCRIALSDLGDHCVTTPANEKEVPNPFTDDIPKETTLKGVEIGTSAYHAAFGLPHNGLAYVLIDAEPGINEVLFVEQAELAGFYRFNGRSDDGLLLTDPLTGKTQNVLLGSIKQMGVVVGYQATDLSRRTRWELH